MIRVHRSRTVLVTAATLWLGFLPSFVACSDNTCGADGRCSGFVPGPAPVGDGGTSLGTNSDGSQLCGRVSLDTRRVTPQVTVIVDQSGSMRADFPAADGTNDSRWNRVRDALIGPDGIARRLDGIADFGVSFYTGLSDDDVDPNVPAVGTECPLVQGAPVGPMNLAAIESLYEGRGPADDTPTGDAVDRVLSDFLMRLDPRPGPPVFILATDGHPDRCEQLNNVGVPRDEGLRNREIARQESTDAVGRAFDSGIPTFVLGVGDNTVSLDHLQDLADAGLGTPGAGTAAFWTAGDQAGLVQALAEIVGTALTCEIRLEGRIDVASACSGTVQLNDAPLACEDPNGWRAVDEQTIELLGAACDTLLDSAAASVQAEFPCSVVLI